MELKRFSHRDSIWLCLLGGDAGFLQWTNEFPEEYRWPSRILKTLPENFSPARPQLRVEIGEPYRRFQDNKRYKTYEEGKFPGFELNREKQQDENIQAIFAAYTRSLDLGVPIRFTLDDRRSMRLAEFAAMDPAKIERPLQAIGGYQMTWLKDARNPLWIAYLRKRKVERFGSHWVGTPDTASLSIKLDLPRDRYEARLLNLSTGVVENRAVQAKDAIPVSEATSDDYVLILTGGRLRLEL
jgi:hypothetical protein